LGVFDTFSGVGCSGEGRLLGLRLPRGGRLACQWELARNRPLGVRMGFLRKEFDL